MYRKIIVRTHGGLGNQIFQLLYAKCLAADNNLNEIVVIHDDNYKHSFQLSDHFKKYCKANLFHRLLSMMRIPKILKKCKISNSGALNFFGTLFLDEYFQDRSYYSNISSANLRKSLMEVRSDLKLDVRNSVKKPMVMHLRLGDFFQSLDDEKNYAEFMIASIDADVDIVTNNEELVSKLLVNTSLKNHVRIISTNRFDAVDVLKKFGEYEKIFTNGSTLAFWASVFCESDLFTDVSEHLGMSKFYRDKLIINQNEPGLMP